MSDKGRSPAVLIAGLYGAIWLAFQVAIHSPLRAWWPLQVLNIFGLWLYLPLPFLLAWVGLSRTARRTLRQNRGAIALLLIPLLFFSWGYGRLFFPQLPPANAGTGLPLRVMTWNLRISNTKADETAVIVLAQRPDVVAFQEMGNDMLLGLHDRLQADYPYQAFSPRASPDEFGVFSRYPLQDIHSPGLGTMPCRCQRVTLRVDDTPVTLFNVHVPLPRMNDQPVTRLPDISEISLLEGFSTQNQTAQIQMLIAEAKGVAPPVLILGDFNTGDRQTNYGRMQDAFHDTFREVGWGFGLTFPARRRTWEVSAFPVIRIDYVFHSADWRSHHVELGEGGDADHRYIVADLTLHHA